MVKTIFLLLVTIIVLPLVAVKLDPVSLSDMQKHMLLTSGFIAIGVAASCIVVAELTKNYSQVDKIWSVIPVVYAVYFAYASDWDPRITLMAGCALVWGARLTFNFGRRGGYRWKFWEGEEDYRWEVLRQNPLFKGKPVNWKLFAVFFIGTYQNTLLWLITLPAMMAYAGHDKPLQWSDYLLAGLLVVLVGIEATADQQQWNYQNEKHHLKKTGKLTGEYADGFVKTGLWKYSRHPNYACEQAIWVVFYLFSVSATGAWINWTMAGCLLLMVLFQGSADFSEGISMGKYPAYAGYVKRVGRFIPKLF
ncbi:MAG: DUF1295 domain-containing protein [Bacteroidetes bacterium]|nr:DUF1295 domain-containing protein [Bacteroidota bacterium]